MGSTALENVTAADAFLRLLADRGIDTLFGNAGTDFAPIIEAYAKAQALGTPVPHPVTCPHENLAMAMAVGAYAHSGRPKAVMVHVNVGTANAMNMMINAARGNIPLLLFAGRTPYTEGPELPGRRSGEIHWPQEMRDQRAMLRELARWDYELARPEVLEGAVDRALNAAMRHPRGPVYMTLPREVLGTRLDAFTFDQPSRHAHASAPWPDPSRIDQAAAMIAAAENPVIITSGAGQDPGEVAALAALAERFAIPVTQRKPRYLCLPADHPQHAGYNPDPWLATADLICVLECDVPWIPSAGAPPPGCPVIHMGADPLWSDYPIRSFPADMAITGLLAPSLRLLDAALESHEGKAAPRIEARRKRWATGQEERKARQKAALEAARASSPIHPAWISHCLDQARDADAVILKESQLALAQMTLTRPGSFYSLGFGGGLGWSLGAALGIKLTDRSRQVICTVGDGSYMFGNPVPAHYVSEAEKLPVLWVVFNNHMWNAVHRATLGMYPDGYAARANREPLTYFNETTAFEKVVEVAGGHGERVVDPEDLPAAIDRALDFMARTGRQALLNVVSCNG